MKLNINDDNKHLWVWAATLAGILVAFLVVRWLLTSPMLGHKVPGHSYTEKLLKQPIKYQGMDSCRECHQDVWDMTHDKETRRHKNISCEACHGPGLNSHVDRSSNSCLKCHNDVLSREERAPRVNLADHLDENDGDQDIHKERCVACHNPHSKKDEDWVKALDVKKPLTSSLTETEKEALQAKKEAAEAADKKAGKKKKKK